MQDANAADLIISNLVSVYLTPFAHQHRVDFNSLNPYKDKTLREYQSYGKCQIYKMWAQMRSIMYQMPTGTGKTKLFVSIARDLFDWGIAQKIQIKILFFAYLLIRLVKI